MYVPLSYINTPGGGQAGEILGEREAECGKNMQKLSTIAQSFAIEKAR